MKKLYLTADDVAEMLGVSKGYAYSIIRTCNKELKEQGFLSISGKVPVKFFGEKYYGFFDDEKEKKEGIANASI